MDGVKTGRGRPRSEASRTAILTSTRDLLREVGYEGLTIGDVAQRAGVGKQTVYRWWGSKPVLVADCVIDGLVEIPFVIAVASGDLVADLTIWLDASYAAVSAPAIAPLLRALTMTAASDASAAARAEERFIAPLRASVAQTIAAAAARAEVRADADADAVADLLIGALVYALMTGDTRRRHHVPELIRTILYGVHADTAPASPCPRL
ncbi:TetR/AcrR family transcriptional regulator [Microbacterium sp. No. 7]|uniref:TetR/AcrR family transcriptional regulator n=1 Tax=Microbacterium sp. No. 7 TaxID=1714373 RepID=UPI0006CF38C4|nr:helix-turn-helix domain-containing protein [Microbacterium sp. No. 7]